MKNVRIMLLLRGSSGSGKSFLAKNLAFLGDGFICEADNYFIDPYSGEYKFDASKLKEAHEYCKNRFVSALKHNVPFIIVSNTNTNLKEYNFYVDKAKEHDYIVHVVVVENFFDTKDIHNVSFETIQRQKQNIKNSLKL